jgi:pyruvate formate lyase activating enzyme
MERGISKRQFIKCCLAGMGGLALGLDRKDLFASDETNAPGRGNTPDVWKYSREALHFKQTANGLQCEQCPNRCLLGPSDTGPCRNRSSRNGKVYSTGYGNPCAVHIDPIEKKPLNHFLPSHTAFSIAVAGCTLRCLNCLNWQISQFSPMETNNYDLTPSDVVGECQKNRCATIAYTYSEPTTFFEYAYDTAVLAKKSGIRNIWKSNGYINEVPLREIARYLDAANIDLKSFDRDIYVKLNSGGLEPVLKTIKILKEEGVWLEISNLVVPSWTDDLNMIKKMSEWLVKNGLKNCPLHMVRFRPMYKLHQLPPTPVSTLEKAREVAMNAGMRYVYIGNVPRHPSANTYCHECGVLIIERKGWFSINHAINIDSCKFCGTKIPGVWGL